MKNPKKRNFVTCILGTTRTGKHTIAAQRVKEWKQNNKKGKVIAYDPMRRLIEQNLVDIEIKATNKNWAKVLCAKDKKGKYRYANSLLVLNTFRLLESSEMLSKHFADLLNLRTLINIDIIFTVHAPYLIHTRLTYFITNYLILKTNISYGFTPRIPDFAILKDVTKVVNKYVENRGGQDKLNYPIFPYISYNTSTREVAYVNMTSHELIQSLTDCYFYAGQED